MPLSSFILFSLWLIKKILKKAYVSSTSIWSRKVLHFFIYPTQPSYMPVPYIWWYAPCLIVDYILLMSQLTYDSENNCRQFSIAVTHDNKFRGCLPIQETLIGYFIISNGLLVKKKLKKSKPLHHVHIVAKHFKLVI